MDKTCSDGVKARNCQYAAEGGNYIYCKYEGYCDYQLPNDSRLQPLTPPKQQGGEDETTKRKTEWNTIIHLTKLEKVGVPMITLPRLTLSLTGALLL